MLTNGKKWTIVLLVVALFGWTSNAWAQFNDVPVKNPMPVGADNLRDGNARGGVDDGRQYQMARNILRKGLPCKKCSGKGEWPCPRCKGKEGRSRCTEGCGGTGIFHCLTCKGSGITLGGTVALPEFKEELSGGAKIALNDCEICGGSGKIEKPCYRCGGSGYQITKECDQCQRYGAATGLGVRPNCPACVKGSSRCTYCRFSPGKSSKPCDRCTGKKLLEKYLK